ncbi:glycosyltransferase [Micromonospora echinofusca]|uniref:glycosyltransferase n=1 Tax=Micromonospora echinofusca TaxID=47858 RepID=UPI00379C7A2F
MRVALLGPVAWRTPPRHYGPWEQVIGLLAEGLVARGVDVTLFATLDSLTSAALDGVCPRGHAEDQGMDGLATLGALIRSADVVVLPSDSTEQVTSGVLTEAVAAGVPVVATPFPHAVGLLTGGPGLSPTASVRCAATPSGPCCSTCTGRSGSSRNCPGRCWPRRH